MQTTDLITLKNFIESQAYTQGFDDIGFAKVEELSDQKPRLNFWLENNFHATMDYLNKNVEKRLNPSLLFENAKTVIVFIKKYEADTSQNLIAKYAQGIDYHINLKERLKKIETNIKVQYPDFACRNFVDTAPIMEKVWAVKAGLGFQGKNTCLISPKFGSFVFIGIMLITIDIPTENKKLDSLCNDCSLCIDSCPTQALINPGYLNANKCLSYLTIEHKGDVPEPENKKLNTSFFGCDICQNVCPYNKPFIGNVKVPTLKHAQMLLDDWLNLDEKAFQEIKKNTAIERISYSKLKSNLLFHKQFNTKG